MPNQIDPTIKALVSSIGEAETGPSTPQAYEQKGKSGEFGRYQFMPDTYKAYAKKYLGDSNAQPNVENQNKIAYAFVNEKKQAGFNPAQIASMWNAGEGEPDAYKGTFKNGNPSKGINGLGVHYDVPGYAQRVSQFYQQKKGQTAPTGGFNPAPFSNPSPGQFDFSGTQTGANAPDPNQGTFVGDVSNTLGKAGTGVAKAFGDTLSGQINPLSGLIQGVGSIAGGVSGLVSNTLEHTPIVGGIVKGAEGLIGQGVQAAANTGIGQDVIGKYQQFAQAHPELAGDISSGIDIATAIPVLKGLGIAKDVAKTGLSTALKGSVDSTLETIAPKLTAKEAAKALQSRGTVQKGLLRETQLTPDPKMQKVAEAVKSNVPKFNPSKPLLNNISEVQTVVSNMSKQLKQAVQTAGADRIYPKRELISKLRQLEKPDLIAADNTLNNVYNRLIKRVESLANKSGGKVSNLLDLRLKFDALVKSQYPNLYNSETLTPLRQGVKDIRNAITDFTAENLPDGFGLRESLFTQHHLITAIENMAEKATSGATKEIGSNAISRLAGKHPVISGLVKAGAKYGAMGAGLGGVEHLIP